ncbi:28S ribosomal protein S5, mitochondrial-like [Haliotis rufescens]|uniref:28S ribosomal protein S5, mitochondrial-like n=1 Tax=Haliotis rufescens TaxID=6454 RepID=UPI00201E9819|nr:28S ribosomal protein S5, mitochondrial-like [Haliotis rufescens]
MAGTSCLGVWRLASACSSQTRAMLRCARLPVVTETAAMLCQHSCCRPQLILYRNAGFFNRLTADELWQGVQGVSNAGKKRGRGKLRTGGRRRINLNRGQVIGEGSTAMVWPGLNTQVIQGSHLLRVQQLSANTQRMKRIQEARDKGTKRKSIKTPALKRGFTGAKFPGQSVGAPDPVGDYEFEGFDAKILEFKLVANMTGNLGKKFRSSAFVVTGNKNGLAGYALAKSSSFDGAFRKAKNMASQRLQYVDRFQGHTVYHNFYSKEKETAVMVRKAAKGHGLRCHRVLKTICEIIGIEDIYVKVEGSTGNVQNMTKAFFKGLQKQESHQELSERMNLHLVELRRERDYFPNVIASPTSEVSTKGVKEEVVNFENLYFRGRVPLYKAKTKPFWQKHPHWYIKWAQLHVVRNQPAAQLERRVVGFEPSTEEKSLRQLPLKGTRE